VIADVTFNNKNKSKKSNNNNNMAVFKSAVTRRKSLRGCLTVNNVETCFDRARQLSVALGNRVLVGLKTVLECREILSNV